MKIFSIKISASNLERMKEFYTDDLECVLMDESPDSFTCQARNTTITFERSTENALYHLCFRTDSHNFDHFYKKLEDQDNLIPNKNGQTLMFWEGKQCYFYDPDGNILEIIERNVPVEKGLYDVSEVGMPTEDIRSLQNELPFLYDRYKGDDEIFTFFGDERGVFVVVKVGRNWYPTQKPAVISPLTLSVSGKEDRTYKHTELPYVIHVKKE
ncbi:VOC family protein [Peribacillus sp. SCS-155]|uniref:VOC family protein n=1 Tax=Peribacillus sedimenti TaxID=3115297 RepID=UPI003906BB00